MKWTYHTKFLNFLHSFKHAAHSFNQYIWDVFYVPTTQLDLENTMVWKRQPNSYSSLLYRFLEGKRKETLSDYRKRNLQKISAPLPPSLLHYILPQLMRRGVQQKGPTF